MDLLVINGKSFTHHIKVPSYKVNRADVAEEWKNGNYRTRKEVVRTKVSGSFTLLYDLVEELDDFFDTVEAAKNAHSDHSITMTVYLNNLHTTATIDAFIKYTPANERPLFGREKVSGFEVTIEEK